MNLTTLFEIKTKTKKQTNHSKINQKKVGFMAKKKKKVLEIKRDTIIMCLIHQEDITILNLCVPNTQSLKTYKAKMWTELQEGRHKSTIIVEHVYQ